MGVVWRSFDLELEEEVAIKFLREDFGRDEKLRALFRREVKLARRVTHPNVARVFELGREGDLYFLTMEYIAGESLHEQLAWLGPMPARRVPGFAVSLCRGLAAAHAAGVVHGDIKPGNIMLDPVRGAVLTDFGIARALSEAAGDEQDSSGTPLYMPPERIAGDEFSLASDVYAVGVVLFEALTGKAPWTEVELDELMHAKCLRGELDLQRIAPELAPAWLGLIGDCLRFAPGERPVDAAALLQRLTDLHATEVLAAPMRPASAPVATGNGATWVRVAPGRGAGHGGAGEPAPGWLTGDMVQALTRVRGLRVATGDEGEAAGPATALRQVRCETHATTDGVRVSLHIEGGEGPDVAVELEQPATALHNLGGELAARIVASIAPDQLAAMPPRHAELDAETAALYVRAREAELSLRLAAAVQHYEAALARAPRHPLLQLGRTLARIHVTFQVREPDAREVEVVRGLAEDAVARHPEVGEAHLAMAGVRLCVNDPIGCARSVRAALRCGPGLVHAHGLVSDLLIDIGRLPDAERHLDIAGALDAHNMQAALHRTRLRAYQGRWDEYYALLEGELSRVRFRSVASLRGVLWQPEPAPLQRLARALADNDDGMPEAPRRDAHELVLFALGEGDRPAILDRFAADYPRTSRSRHGRVVAQIQCEMACQLGQLERAAEFLGHADSLALIDWHWLDACPSLAPLRAAAWFQAIAGRVRARADAVAEAIWDPTGP